MTISHYIVWFALFSFLGWVFECVLNIMREGAWENRGFLYGPACPIYGAGVVLFMFAFDNPIVASGQLPIWGVLLAAMAGSAVLEYATSVLMEKAFGARWWDYSNMPLNLNGRICLPASLLFGVGGVATVLVLIPAAHLAAETIPSDIWELAALAIVAIFAVDGTLSFSALTEILAKVEQASSSFDRAMGNGVHGAQDKARGAAGKITQGANRARVEFQLLNALTFGRITNVTADQQRIPSSVQSFVNGLTNRQRRVLASIKGYGSGKATAFGQVARQAMHRANARVAAKRDRTGKPTSADVQKRGPEQDD